MAYRDRVRFATATTGTGPVTVGAAASGFVTPATAGFVDGEELSYAIEDGTAWETGSGIYTAAGATIARTLEASSTGALLVLSGTATMFVSPTAGHLNKLPSRGKILALSIGMPLN